MGLDSVNRRYPLHQLGIEPPLLAVFAVVSLCRPPPTLAQDPLGTKFHLGQSHLGHAGISRPGSYTTGPCNLMISTS